MISRITNQIQLRRESNEIALVGFLPIGFPNEKEFKELVNISVNEGVDAIELGIPIDNPYLDGKIIREANKSVLKAGWNTDQLIEMGGRALQASGGIGIALVYSETIEASGRDEFFKKLSCNGYHGILAPNADRDQRQVYKILASKYAMEIMGFVRPDNTQVEIREVIDQSQGFIYMQGIDGATGQQIQVDQELINRYVNLKAIAKTANLPVLIGFGIHDAEDVARIRDIHADGAILGTSFVTAASKPQNEFRLFVQKLAQAKRVKS